MRPMRPLIASTLKSATWSRYAFGVAVLLAIDAETMPAVELIRNGSFENDGFVNGPVVTDWDDATNGENNRGFGLAVYPFVSGGVAQQTLYFEFPTDMPSDFEGTPRPVGAGQFFGARWGWGNGTGRSGSATQLVNVSEFRGKPFAFGAWISSLVGSDADYAVVSLEFFSGPFATGDSLGTTVFDGNDQQSSFIVGSMNIGGIADPAIAATQDNWTFYRAQGLIPPMASNAAVTIRGATISRNGDDAYVDLVSLQVIPEPATALLAIAGMLAAAVLARI